MSSLIRETGDNHPLMVPQAVVFETSEIKRMQEHILRWLWTGCTGGYIVGEARVGKSTAMEIIESEIRLRNGKPVPTHLLTIPPRDKPTVNALLRLLCLSVDLRVTNSSKPDVMESDFISYIMDVVNESDTNRFVLFVDEVQRLSPRQLEVFALLYDRLRILHVSLMTVFIGNSRAIEPLLDYVKDPLNEHLRGRFFCQHVTFRGLSSLNDIKSCLGQYDQLTYPASSKTSYTAYFLPRTPSTWKLASLAPLLWQTFRIYKNAYGLSTLGMQYFRAIVDTLLMDFLPRFGVENVDEEMVSQCFELSGIVASQVSSD